MALLNMQKLFRRTLSILVAAAALPVAAVNEYFTFDEYYRINPEELPLLEKLSQLNSNPVQVDMVNQLKGKNVSISFVSPSLQLSDYWIRTERVINRRLEEYGLIVTSSSKATKINENRLYSAALIDELKNERDYIIMTVDTERQRRLLVRILTLSDISSKIIVNNLTTPFKQLSREPFFYAGFDHFEAGRMIGEAYQSFTMPVSVCMPKGVVANQRLDGFLAGYQKPLTQVLRTNGTPEGVEKIQKEITTWLDKKPEIFACNTDIAIGFIDLFDGFYVNGLGGGDVELDALQLSRLSVTAARYNDDVGVAIADAIALDLLGEKVPKTYSGEWILLYPDFDRNDFELRAFRYSN